MNREIKFRAWDKGSLEMIENGQHPITPTWILHSKLYEPYGQRYELMQYTGLKDKDGKEIYEGDILQDNFGKKMKVYWQDGAFVVGHDKDGKFWMDNFLNQYVEIEIVGNIYENPELLTNKQ